MGAIEKSTSYGDCNLEDEILGEERGKDGERFPLRVLDVGSCYNPFGELEGWQVKMYNNCLHNLEFLLMADFVVHL